MAWSDLLDDDLIDSVPPEGVTVYRSEVTGPQHDGWARDFRRATSVPATEQPNDFRMTGPFTRDAGGIASRFELNPMLGAFPSVTDDDNGLAAGRAHMRNLLKAQKNYALHLSASDPQGAGVAFADMDGMKDAFNALTNKGWNGREAAHAVGMTGRVFGGYGNAVENAEQLKWFADSRGMDLQTAGNVLWSLQKNFGAGYLTGYGFDGKVTPDSAHYENIRNNFTDLLSAFWKVERQYNWRFDDATYQDVFNRCRGIAADLDRSGFSVKGVGAEAIVRAALKENGSLNDDAMLSAPVTRLMQSRARDRDLVTLSPGFPGDTAGNPFGVASAGSTAREREAAADDNRDFGLVRQLRQALFRHRAGSVNAGRDADDFSDTSTLRNEFANAFRMFSTGSANVSDDTFLRLADEMIDRGVAQGRPVSVTEAAQKLAESGAVGEAQAGALAVWSRSLMMDTAEGERMLRETVYPFIEQIAMEAGVSPKDPSMAPFVARAYSLVRRTLGDRRVVASLEGLGDEATDQRLWAEVRARLEPLTKKLGEVAAAKNAQLAQQAEAVAEARARAKEEGS